jgi:hypothetical protein
MRRVRLSLIAVAVAAALALAGAMTAGTASAMATAAAAKSPPAARHTAGHVGDLSQLSCVSGALCFAVSVRDPAKRPFGIARLTDHGSKLHETAASVTTQLSGLSCPSKAGCEALGSSAPNYTPQAFPVSISGHLGKPVSLTDSSPAGAQAVACHSVRTNCTFAGAGHGMIQVQMLVGSTLTSKTEALPQAPNEEQIDSIDCPSSSFCLAVGNAFAHGKVDGLVVPITAGVPGTPILIARGASQDANAGIVQLSCATATKCYAAGIGQSRSFVYTLTNGKLTHTATMGKGIVLFGIACRSAHVCDAVGEDQGPHLRNSGGAIVPIKNGRPGKAQTTSVTSCYGASRGGNPENGAAGFRGGIITTGTAISAAAGYRSITSSS